MHVVARTFDMEHGVKGCATRQKCSFAQASATHSDTIAGSACLLDILAHWVLQVGGPVEVMYCPMSHGKTTIFCWPEIGSEGRPPDARPCSAGVAAGARATQACVEAHAHEHKQKHDFCQLSEGHEKGKTTPQPPQPPTKKKRHGAFRPCMLLRLSPPCSRAVGISSSGQLLLATKKPFRSKVLPCAAMEALRAKRAAQTSALKALTQRVREADVRARTGAEGPSILAARQRCPMTLLASEIVYHLAGGDRQAAEEFFALSRRNKTPSTSRLAPTLLHEWATRSPEAVALLVAGGNETDAARRRAEKFLAERGLRDWVMQQNLMKACAPRARAVLHEASRRGVAGEPAGHARRRAVVFQWVRRWACRFRLLRGRFQPGARLRPAASLQKAQQPTAGWEKRHPWESFLAPISGPPRGPKIGTIAHVCFNLGAARRPPNRGHMFDRRVCQGHSIMEVGESLAGGVPARSPGHPSQHG